MSTPRPGPLSKDGRHEGPLESTAGRSRLVRTAEDAPGGEPAGQQEQAAGGKAGEHVCGPVHAEIDA